MVDLILETGAGLSNANSYADLIYANDYFESHPYYSDAWSEITDPVRKESLLIAATYFIDSQFSWAGYRLTTTQALDWPRQLIPDPEGRYTYLSSAMPDQVRRATCEQARFMSLGDPTAPRPSAGITDLRIDVIELSFDKAARPATMPSPVMIMLRGLGEYVSGSRVRKVLVG